MTGIDYTKKINDKLEKLTNNSNIDKKTLELLVADAYNNGKMAGTKATKISLNDAETKELSEKFTHYLPENFVNSDECNFFFEGLLNIIVNNSINYKLNVGFEKIFAEDSKQVLKACYTNAIANMLEIILTKNGIEFLRENYERLLYTAEDN